MSRGRAADELAELKEQATALRLAGIGAKRIAKELRVSPTTVSCLLRDVPVPSSLTRPNARDVTRAAAERLRTAGRTYDEIAAELGVSKGSLSLWLRDLPHPSEDQRVAISSPERALVVEPSDRRGAARVLRNAGYLLREIGDELGVSVVQAHRWTKDLPCPSRAVHGRSPEETKAMGRLAWDRRLAADDAERAVVIESVAARVPLVSDEVLDLLAAVAYWCEGTKRKPWNRKEALSFINSDADVIRMWLAWLQRRGVEPDRIRLRVNIHESADLAAATAYWADVAQRSAADFSRPTLKRHNPKTVRKNVGDGYHGCLAISVLRSRDLYRQVEGTWRGIVTSVLGGAQGSPSPIV